MSEVFNIRWVIINRVILRCQRQPIDNTPWPWISKQDSGWLYIGATKWCQAQHPLTYICEHRGLWHMIYQHTCSLICDFHFSNSTSLSLKVWPETRAFLDLPQRPHYPHFEGHLEELSTADTGFISVIAVDSFPNIFCFVHHWNSGIPWPTLFVNKWPQKNYRLSLSLETAIIAPGDDFVAVCKSDYKYTIDLKRVQYKLN